MAAFSVEARRDGVGAGDGDASTRERAMRLVDGAMAARRGGAFGNGFGGAELDFGGSGGVSVLDDRADALMRGWLGEKRDLTLGELYSGLKMQGYSANLGAVLYRLRTIGIAQQGDSRLETRDDSAAARHIAGQRRLFDIPVRNLAFLRRPCPWEECATGASVAERRGQMGALVFAGDCGA